MEPNNQDLRDLITQLHLIVATLSNDLDRVTQDTIETDRRLFLIDQALRDHLPTHHHQTNQPDSAGAGVEQDPVYHWPGRFHD